MAEFDGIPRPLAKEISIITNAIKGGMADELPYWGLIKGLDVCVMPADDTSDGTTYVRMEPLGGKQLFEYQFAPPPEEANPMAIIEEDEMGDLCAKPVLARMVVSSDVLLMPIGKRDGLPLKASLIQVDVLDEGAVLSVNDSLGIRPIVGEYDDDAYRYIRRRSYDQLKLGNLMDFAKDFPAA